MIEKNIPSNIPLFNNEKKIEEIINSNLPFFQEYKNNEIKFEDLKRRLLMLSLLEEKRRKREKEMEEKKQFEKINNHKIEEKSEQLSESYIKIQLRNSLNDISLKENNNIQNILNLSFNLQKKGHKLSRSFSPQNISSSQKVNSKALLNPIIKKKTQTYKLKYNVIKGNNTPLIEKCFEYRNKVWEKSEFKIYCDLLWAPLSKDIDFTNAQIHRQYVNHLEFHKVISNKKNLFLSLLRHCEKKNYNLFSFFPFTIIIELKKDDLQNQIDQFKILYNDIESYINKNGNVLKNTKYNELFNTYQIKKLGSIQKIEIPETHYTGHNLWILKAVNLNRGMCIKVENNLENIEKTINDIKEHYKMDNLDGKKKKCKRIILQKYLEKPLLYHGRKFDIRLWVLFIGNKPDEVYVFKEGHLKATCSKYDLDSNDPYIHLTNYSVQKHNSDFSKIEIGNEIPFKDLQKQFDEQGLKINFKKMIYPKICKIVRITAGAAREKINIMNRKNCFEIFGYDFMIDEKYNPFLIEINTNPGFEFSSPLCRTLLPRLIDDTFKLTIDKEFFSSNLYINIPSPFEIEGYSNEENMLEKFNIL